MKTLNKMIQAFWLEESGLTAVEYGVAGTLVLLGVVAAFTLLGTNLDLAIRAIAGALVAP
jgi:pilus assembly protein Flp/PilA